MASTAWLSLGLVMYTVYQTEAACPPAFDYVYQTDICIGVVTENQRSYYDAREACKELGGKLAEPVNDEMVSFLRAAAAIHTDGFSGFWIGINDIAEEGRYVYDSNGENIKTSDWDEGYSMPNGMQSRDCVMMYFYDLRWFDFDCSSARYYICQYGPPVDGGWTRFSPFSECSTTCGYGVHNRSRSCTNPAPEFGGRDCEGSSSTVARCTGNPPCTDACTLNPCKNGGTCRNLNDSANARVCECHQYYTTPDCEACSCWNFDDCDQARCVVVVLLYTLIIVISGVGAGVIIKLWIWKKKNAGKAWTSNKK